MINETGKSITEKINALLVDNGANNALIQGNSMVVNKTPTFDLTQIKFASEDIHVVHDIISHQLEARKILSEVNDNKSSPLIEQAKNLSEVIGFCNMWLAYHPKIEELLKKLNEGTNKEELINGLQILKRNVSTKSKNYGVIIQQLNSFKTAIDNSKIDLKIDQTIFKNYFNSKGEALAIEKQVTDIQAKLNADNETLSQGATKQGLGVLIITAVVLAEIAANKGAEKPKIHDGTKDVIGFGINMVKDGIKEQNDATKDFNANIGNYHDLLVTLKYDQQVYFSVNEFISSLSNLSTYLELSVKNEELIQNQWNNFAYYFDSISKDVSETSKDAPIELITELQDFNSAIINLKKDCIFRQSNATIPIETRS